MNLQPNNIMDADICYSHIYIDKSKSLLITIFS